MKNYNHLSIFLLFLHIFYACQAQKNEKITNDSLQQYYQKRFTQFFQKDAKATDYISITPYGITLYNSLKAKNIAQAEWEVAWADLPKLIRFLQHNPQKAQLLYEKGMLQEVAQWDTIFSDTSKIYNPTTPPLKGWRIALDPGHLAHNLATAKIEGKYIEMKLDEKQLISFYEARLNWFTARILQKKLEAQGAEVMLTRTTALVSAMDENLDDWFEQYQKQNPTLKLNERDKNFLFAKNYHKKELQERVIKINTFKPDLTLIIHYNVDANNAPWKKPTPDNYSMAFVGGAFLGSDLKDSLSRFNLLRLLLTKDLEQSTEFSATVLQSIEHHLKISPISAINNQKFLQENCLPTSITGVYLRGLTLSKNVFGTVCYAEPLYQDNEREVKLLNQKNFSFEGEKLPRRVEEVAQAYLNAILIYSEKKKKN